MFNEIDGDFDEVAVRTFKVGLSSKHGLRKSLTGKLVTSLHQLMDRVDKYKRIENDQQQGKGKAKVILRGKEGFQVGPIQQQLAEKGLCRSIRVKQYSGHRRNLSRAGTSSIGKNQE